MHTIGEIQQQIAENGDLTEIRRAIAELIVHRLQAVKESFGYWEKIHFADAISSLALNVNSLHQPTFAWLRLCLVDLEHALVPADQRNENYTPRDQRYDAVTYNELMEAIEGVRIRL